MHRVPRAICAAAVIFTILAIASSGAFAADLEAAKDNFGMFCTKCHGKSGHGDGPSAATLKTKPRDLTDCDRMAKITDDVMFKVIKNGGQSEGLSGDMAAWADGFEDEEIHDLVAFIRTFCSK